MNTVKVHDKSFHIYIEAQRINERVKELAALLNKDFEGEQPLFVAVLNGSFMFAADLLKNLEFACEIQFVKVSSYHGTQSSGKIQQVLGLSQPVKGRRLVIIEDIIDSGLTIDFLQKQLALAEPKSMSICSLLVKPKALKVALDIAYTGFEVENEFLVGYGLDYDGLGRNLRHLYQVDKEE
jgi:hypoxanthine phosphoribosyltransferase